MLSDRLVTRHLVRAVGESLTQSTQTDDVGTDPDWLPRPFGNLFCRARLQTLEKVLVKFGATSANCMPWADLVDSDSDGKASEANNDAEIFLAAFRVLVQTLLRHCCQECYIPRQNVQTRNCLSL